MYKTNYIKPKANIETLLSYFGKRTEVSLDELRDFFKINDPAILDATIRWRVHDLIAQSAITRIGRGKYQLSSKNQYLPLLAPNVYKVGKFLSRNFPTTSYCAWHSGMVNEFAHHLSSYTFILIDVERDVAESVYFRLKEEFKGVFLRPSEKLINEVLPDFQQPIIVRYLTTESPLVQVNHIFTASIEKILADIFCDMEFNFLAGSERRSIYTYAYYKYVVNESKLLRYAARKGRRQDLQQYLQEGNFSNQINNTQNQ